MGRKAKITRENFIKAVLKTKGFNSVEIGEVLRVSRTAVNSYRKKNPDVVRDAENKLNEIENIRFDAKYVSKEMYLRIPVVKEWLTIMHGRELKKHTIDSRINAIYNICKHLEVSPEKLTLDMCRDLIIEIKIMDSVPIGLSYTYIRKPIRSFFQLIHGISGELLTTKGIKADRINLGSYASEFVTREQRSIFESSLYGFVCKTIKNPEINESVFNEILAMFQFMFYTGSRITATMNINTIDRKHKLSDKEIVELHIIDKGDLQWNKKLIGDGIVKMNNYVKANLGIEDISKLSTISGKLFPWINEIPENLQKERKIVRQALEYAGVVELIQPNHIMRHTFAQEALRASNWNYEIVAELGGWSTSEELKKSYGKIGGDVLNRGLREMLGLKVDKEKYELRW